MDNSDYNGEEKRRRQQETWNEKAWNLELHIQTLIENPNKMQNAKAKWRENGGAEMEPALQSGAISLLDALWLANFQCRIRKHGTTSLPCRQELEENYPEAFISLERLQACTTSGIPIVCLSYMWLHPDHPDSKGSTLQKVANHCRIFLDESQPTFGIFWDYASLYQRNVSKGRIRTPVQESLFRQGLDAMATFYSHPQSTCWQVSQFPEHYPRGYDLPPGAHCAKFHDRGWPFFESCLVSLCKSSGQVFDISGNMTRKGFAPLVPERMRHRLCEVTFTNSRSDRPLVLKLYTYELRRRMGEAKELYYNHLGWDNHQLHSLSQAIQNGTIPRLKRLNLIGNVFCVEGCRHLAAALLNGTTDACNISPQCLLTDLWLSDNCEIGNEGVQVLAGALVRIHRVEICRINLSVAGCHALASAAESANNVRLRKLNVQGNPIGDKGLDVLSDLASQSLIEVDLLNCGIAGERIQAN